MEDFHNRMFLCEAPHDREEWVSDIIQIWMKLESRSNSYVIHLINCPPTTTSPTTTSPTIWIRDKEEDEAIWPKVWVYTFHWLTQAILSDLVKHALRKEYYYNFLHNKLHWILVLWEKQAVCSSTHTWEWRWRTNKIII